MLDSSVPARLRAAFYTLWGALAAIALVALSCLAPGTSAAYEKVAFDALVPVFYLSTAGLVLVRALVPGSQRRPLLAIAGGLAAYGAGNIIWIAGFPQDHVPPLVCDAVWLWFFPLCYAGIIGLVRGRRGADLPPWIWLDGVIVGFSLLMLGSALVLPRILDHSTATGVKIAVEVAYPMGDLLLAALVVGALALRSWRLNRMWRLLVVGFLSLAAADCAYAVETAHGHYQVGSVTNLLYLAVILIAAAVWQRDEPPEELSLTTWSMVAVPGVAITGPVVLLIWASYSHRLTLEAGTFIFPVIVFVAGAVRFLAMFRDVRSLARVRVEAATDDLTGLANRRAFMRRLESLFSGSPSRRATVALVLIDLDNFKQLNDTLGHPAGDALLAKMGPRLIGAVREGDMVARLGGDEFAVLLSPAPDGVALTRICDVLRAVISQPVEIGGLTLRSTGSLGVSVSPDGGRDAHELMQHADVAMYQAKTQQRGYVFYAPLEDPHSAAQLSLTGELAAAIDGGEIEVHFQPQVEPVGRRIISAEALVRWRTTTGRLIQPADWIPVAEQAGLARALTTHVLARTLDKAAALRHEGHEISVSINTAVADLLDSSFPTDVAEALAARGLAPECLTVEVTETSIMVNPARIETTLWELHRQGVRIALDDFGTGYSSLEHLRSLPVSEVKLDRSFVIRMHSDPTDAAIVEGVVNLAHKLGLRVVAEGVEHPETWEAVSALGCDLIQGYGYSPAVPSDEFDRLLAGATDDDLSIDWTP